jgi:uncharacterized delta-60 repeat protein
VKTRTRLAKNRTHLLGLFLAGAVAALDICAGGQPGSLDDAFDLTARGRLTGIAGHEATIRSLAIQPNGQTLVGGYFIGLNGRPRLNVGRLNPDGSLDESFAAQLDGWVSQVVCQPDGRIVLAGQFTSVNGTARPYVARLNADSTLDADFAPVFGGTSDRFGAGTITACVLDKDGAILVGGAFLSVNGVGRTNLVRLLPDGAVDPAFVPQDCDSAAHERGVKL